jgi:hypothetical protein
MIEHVYDFGTEAQFITAAKLMGLWREATAEDAGGPIQYGDRWFFNISGPCVFPTGNFILDAVTRELVPETQVRGYWGRLRWMREDPIPPTPPGVTEYSDPENMPQVAMIA